MNLFHVIDGAHAILRGKNGVYRQVKCYLRGDEIFAGYGSGFVRLYQYRTSVPTLHLDGVELPFSYHFDGHGRMVKGEKYTALRKSRAA